MMRVTTLNISTKTIKYMVFRDGRAVEWGTVPLAGVIKNGLIQEPVVIGAQLKSLFAPGKLPREKIICSINGLPFSYRFFTLPKMQSASINEAVTRMAKQEMPLAPEDMYLSWRAYPSEKDEWQFLVAGVTRRPVDALIQATSAAGIRPHRICLPHLALATLTSRDNAIIVDFEPDYSNITLVVQGVPVGMHTVQLSAPDANLQDMTGQLIREITRMTGFYNDNHPKNPIPESTAILLTGELSGESETSRLIQRETGYPVEIFDELPANTITIPKEVPLSTFAVNIGNALLDIQQGHPTKDPNLVHDINLPGIIEERAGIKKPVISIKQVLLSIVLVIGIGALIPAYLSFHQDGEKITRLQAALQQAKQELTKTQEAAVLAKQTENTINEIISSTQQVKQEIKNLLNPKDSMSNLNFLTQSLPAATTFNTIDINSNIISINGITSAPERVIEYVRTLESSGKFAAANIIWIDRYSSASSNMPIAFLITITW